MIIIPHNYSKVVEIFVVIGRYWTTTSTYGHCGKEFITKDLIKGYEYDKEHYVVITDDDLEKIKTEKEKSIQILHFAQLNQISPIYYDKTFQATPEAGGDKAFELLRAALMSEQKISIKLIISLFHE